MTISLVFARFLKIQPGIIIWVRFLYILTHKFIKHVIHVLVPNLECLVSYMDGMFFMASLRAMRGYLAVTIYSHVVKMLCQVILLHGISQDNGFYLVVPISSPITYQVLWVPCSIIIHSFSQVNGEQCTSFLPSFFRLGCHLKQFLFIISRRAMRITYKCLSPL